MKCFWVADRVRTGIVVARRPQPYIDVWANRSETPMLVLAEELATFIEEGPSVPLVVTEATVIEERQRIVLGPPRRRQSTRALVLIETHSGIGGQVDWRPSRGVKTLPLGKRHVHFYPESQALEAIAIVEKGATIGITRTGDDLDDGENGWTRATLSWDGRDLRMVTRAPTTPRPPKATSLADLRLAS